MPTKPAHDPRYGYDPETHTVRVDQHDLARLLLMFRFGPRHAIGRL
ncbi:hypothetical protein [Streptomyces griseoluteus]|nr:hypothetical protein [Streptomyces griseoluteus]